MSASDQINDLWAAAENCRAEADVNDSDVAMIYATKAVSIEIRALAILVAALVPDHVGEE